MLLHQITPKKGGIIDSHKDERPTTIEEDQRERLKLKEELSKCIHPLHPEGHPTNYFNFITGEVKNIANSKRKNRSAQKKM